MIALTPNHACGGTVSATFVKVKLDSDKEFSIKLIFLYESDTEKEYAYNLPSSLVTQ